jgi:hypothetical protein
MTAYFSNKKNVFRIFQLASFLLFLFFCLSYPYNQKWQQWPDCHDYLLQSFYDFDSGFFFPVAKGRIATAKPFAIPFIYKCLHHDPELIIPAQKIMYAISVSSFISALCFLFSTYTAKYLWSFCAFVIFMLWPNYGWTTIALSESFALIILLFWIATLFHYERNKKTYVLVLHVICTLFCAFSRDNMPYLLLIFYSGFLVLKFINKENKAVITSLLAFSFLLYFFHNESAKPGARFKMPISHSIFARIVPNDEHLQWFTDKGMPLADTLKKYFRNVERGPAMQGRIYDHYGDPVLKPFFDWVTKSGKSTYMNFVLTHPSYFLLLEEDSRLAGFDIFSYEFFYFDPANGFDKWLLFLLDVLSLPFMFVLCVLTTLSLFKWKKLFGAMSFILITFIIYVLLVYNSDTLEVKRHMYLNNIFLNLFAFIGILMNAERWSLVWKTHKANRIQKN